MGSAVNNGQDKIATGKLLVKSINPEAIGIDFVHQENDFVDFKVEVLLPYQFQKWALH